MIVVGCVEQPDRTRHISVVSRVRNTLLQRVLLALALLVSAGGLVNGQDHAGQYAQADIEFGVRVYADNCSTCHGASGEGVPGVNLRSGQFRQVFTDRDLTRTILNGIPDTAMPPGEYSPAELSGLVAFIRTMDDIDPGTLTLGDASRGQVVFAGKGDCLSCHRIAGRGSRMAPDLTDIGASRSAGALERSLLDPTDTMLPVNRPVSAVTRDGRVVTGRRLNEDTFTVQIIDQDGRLVSLEKADLSEYTVITTSPMPSYEGQLNDQELSDLLAYLLSLKGID